jgi:hypothetical protein
MICLMRKEVAQAEDLLNQSVAMCREAGRLRERVHMCLCARASDYVLTRTNV